MQAAQWCVEILSRAWPNKQVYHGFSMGSIQHAMHTAQEAGPRTSTVVQHSFRALLQLECVRCVRLQAALQTSVALA